MGIKEIVDELLTCYDNQMNTFTYSPGANPQCLTLPMMALYGGGRITITGLYRDANGNVFSPDYQSYSIKFGGTLNVEGKPFVIGITISQLSLELQPTVDVHLEAVEGFFMSTIWQYIGDTPSQENNVQTRIPSVVGDIWIYSMILNYVETDVGGCYDIDGEFTFEYCKLAGFPQSKMTFTGVGTDVFNDRLTYIRLMSGTWTPLLATMFTTPLQSSNATNEAIFVVIGVIDKFNIDNYFLDEDIPPETASNIYKVYCIDININGVKKTYYLYTDWFFDDGNALLADFYSTGRTLSSWREDSEDDAVLCLFSGKQLGTYVQKLIDICDENNIQRNLDSEYYFSIHFTFLVNREPNITQYTIIDLDFKAELFRVTPPFYAPDGCNIFISGLVHYDYIYSPQSDDNDFVSTISYVDDIGKIFFPDEEIEAGRILPQNSVVEMEIETTSGAMEFTAEAVPLVGLPYYPMQTSASVFNPAFGALWPQAFRSSKDNMLDGLKIISLMATGSIRESTLFVSFGIDTSSILTYHIGNFEVTVNRISGYLNYSPHNVGLGLSGVLTLGFSTKFSLFLSGSYDDGLWTFEALLQRGDISITEIIENVLGWNLDLDLAVSRLHIRYVTNGTYFLALGIKTAFKILDNKVEIGVEGEISKTGPDSSAVMLRGQLEIQSFLFMAKINIKSDGSRILSMLLKFDGAELTASYAESLLNVEVNNLTIGILLKLLFKVWRPNVKFYLPRPWDVLERVGFPSVRISFNVDTRDVSMYITTNIDLYFVRINGVSFEYKRPTPEDEPKFMVDIDHEWLISPTSDTGALLADTFVDPIKPWDALNGESSAPLDYAGERMFKLHYFGIGRHIDLGLDDVPDSSLDKILNIARANVEPSQSLPVSKYNGKYGWFVGARFTVLESIDVGLLFYDPVLYGLQAKITKNTPLPLEGLDITIYYRKVTDKIGLFYINAALPSRIKRMEFGACSITLPNIEVWIYTNGNFKINFGFPYNNDFSNSFSLSYGIFSGRGGFYFGYLNGDTSTSVPKTTRGYFNPVIELGLGITAGIGRSFSAGPLKLTARLELIAVFSGVFARFNYYSANGEELTQWYYKCTGYVAIAGEVSGLVDFYIIKISFRIYARASICMTLEDGEEGIAAFEASFSVSASVKILFVKVNFSFSFTYRTSFALGSAQPRPWKAVYLKQNTRIAFTTNTRLSNDRTVIAKALVTPYLSIDNIAVTWDGVAYANQIQESKKIAFLMTLSASEFTELIELLADRAFGFIDRTNPEIVTDADTEALLEMLDDGRLAAAFSMESLHQFLDGNFSLEITPDETTPDDVAESNGFSGGDFLGRVPMPFPPVFHIKWKNLDVTEEYDQSLESEKFFCEYILMITKICAEKAAAFLKDSESGQALLSDLLVHLSRLDSIPAMVSRFMLSGTRSVENTALYEWLHQQFNGAAPAGQSDAIVSTLQLEKTGDALWVTNTVFERSITEAELVYPHSPLAVEFAKKPAKVDFYDYVQNVIAMYDKQTVYNLDVENCYLWKFQGNISDLENLLIEEWDKDRLKKQNLRKQNFLSYAPAALFEVGLKCYDTEKGIFTVTSAPEETRALLNAINVSSIVGVKPLFSKTLKDSGENKPKGAFFYDDNSYGDIYLIRRNLSEITTAPVRNILDGENYSLRLGDDPAGFLKLLNKILQIGGMGHYIKIDGEIDGYVFDNEGEASLFFLAELTNTVYANRLTLTTDVGDNKVPVIVNPKPERRAVQTTAEGYTGFRLVIDGQRDEANPFHLLYYKLYGHVYGPLSMQESESDDDGLYYSAVIKLPSSVSPYERITPPDYTPGVIYPASYLDIKFFFADIMGNITSEDQMYMPEPIELKYYDNLYSMGDIPVSAVGYTIDSHNDGFMLSLMVSVMDKESFNENELAVLQTMIYQLEAIDVTIGVKFSVGDYAAEAMFDRDDKRILIKYLKELLEYLKMGSESEKPSDAVLVVVLSNPLPREPQAFYILPIRTEIIISRDIQFVDNDTQLENVGNISSVILPKGDTEDFCQIFEEIFTSTKLMNGEGLFAAIFPKNTLSIAPVDKSEMFFAIKPISTKLITRAGVSVSDLDAEQSEIDFYDIDIEQWAAEFFEFYERILEPLSLACILSGEGASERNNLINSLLKLKTQFAEEIVQRIEGLFNQESIDENAVAAIKDFLRKDLYKGYSAAGAAVYNCNANLGRYSLDGELRGPGGILGAKISGGKGLAFIAAPAVTGLKSEISMEGSSYTFTHAEDSLNNKWYSFVKPFSEFEGYVDVRLGDYEDQEPVNIPIPYRRYPPLPVLTSQTAESITSSISDLKWSYRFDISAQLSAQDKLFVKIYLDDGAGLARFQNRADLFQTLAQFIYNKQAYAQRLLTGESDTAALAHFLETATAIKDNWNTVTLRSIKTSELMLRAVFGDKYLDRLYITKSGAAQALSTPQLFITDSMGNSAQILESDGFYQIPVGKILIEPGALANYSFTTDIELYEYQSLRTELYVRKNDEFLGLKTNPSFVYETQITGFDKPVYPYIDIPPYSERSGWSENAAFQVLANFITSKSIYTELTAYIGQCITGGTADAPAIVYRPAKKRIKHILTESTAREFISLVAKFIEEKNMAEKTGQDFYVKITLKQFAQNNNNSPLIVSFAVEFYLT